MYLFFQVGDIQGRDLCPQGFNEVVSLIRILDVENAMSISVIHGMYFRNSLFYRIQTV